MVYKTAKWDIIRIVDEIGCIKRMIVLCNGFGTLQLFY